jgi:hypothetical protein
MAAGLASGGGGRQFSVRVGCTRRCGARAMTGSSEGSGPALHGGSMAVAEISGTEGAKGGERRKEAPRWGWASFIAARGGG